MDGRNSDKERKFLLSWRISCLDISGVSVRDSCLELPGVSECDRARCRDAFGVMSGVNVRDI